MAGECLHCGVYFELCCVPAGVQPECVPAFIDGLLQRCDGGDQQGRGRALLRTDCRFVLSLFYRKIQDCRIWIIGRKCASAEPIERVLPVRMDFVHCIAGWDDIQFSQALAQAGDDAVFLWKCRRRVSGGAFDVADRDIKKRGLCRTSEYDIPWRLWLFFFRRCAV